MDPVSEWKDNWAYVYNTKVAQNGDAYLVQAIIDGVRNRPYTVKAILAGVCLAFLVALPYF